MSAMNEMSIAITLSMSCSPSPVPRAAASSTFTSVRGMSTFTPPRVSGTSVSGSRIFAIMIVLGAARTHDLVHRDRERLHDDLHDAEVIHDRKERRDKDDRRHDLKREHHADARVLFPDLTEHEF